MKQKRLTDLSSYTLEHKPNKQFKAAEASFPTTESFEIPDIEVCSRLHYYVQIGFLC